MEKGGAVTWEGGKTFDFGTNVVNNNDDPATATRGVNTRSMSKVNFILPVRITRFYKRSPFYRGVVLWNLLPAGIQRATSKVKFKSELEKIENLREGLKKGYN